MKSIKADAVRVAKKLRADDRGFALVEMMVAILILSFVMAGVMDSVAKCKYSTTGIQNQLIAANISQELVDIAKDQNWSTLTSAGNLGTFNLTNNYINKGGTALAGGPSWLNRPLSVDAGTYAANANYQASQYSASTWNAAGGTGQNVFRGTIQLVLTQTQASSATPPYTGQITMTVNITWPSETGGGNRSCVQSTVLTQVGVHN